jgi:hypothetical protein
LGDFFDNFSILEVEIGRNGPGILGVKYKIYSKDKASYVIIFGL